jgi:hypothetical protein
MAGDHRHGRIAAERLRFCRVSPSADGRTQNEPETCEWFVHDFPNGLPEGRWAIWALWEAPCRAWVDLGLTATCRDPGEVISLFSSGFDAPYSGLGPDYTETSR